MMLDNGFATGKPKMFEQTGLILFSKSEPTFTLILSYEMQWLPAFYKHGRPTERPPSILFCWPAPDLSWPHSNSNSNFDIGHWDLDCTCPSGKRIAHCTQPHQNTILDNLPTATATAPFRYLDSDSSFSFSFSFFCRPLASFSLRKVGLVVFPEVAPFVVHHI